VRPLRCAALRVPPHGRPLGGRKSAPPPGARGRPPHAVRAGIMLSNGSGEGRRARVARGATADFAAGPRAADSRESLPSASRSRRTTPKGDPYSVRARPAPLHARLGAWERHALPRLFGSGTPLLRPPPPVEGTSGGRRGRRRPAAAYAAAAAACGTSVCGGGRREVPPRLAVRATTNAGCSGRKAKTSTVALRPRNGAVAP
jgi:hypothetical protein